MANLVAARSRFAIFRNCLQRALLWVLTPMNPYDGFQGMFQTPIKQDRLKSPGGDFKVLWKTMVRL